MEFERAVYRIYERTVEGFATPNGVGDRANKYCKLIEFIVFSVAVFYLWDLIFIHYTFVGQAGCLPSLLQGGPLVANASLPSQHYSLPRDDILLLNLEPQLRNFRQPAFSAHDWDEQDGGTDFISGTVRPLPQSLFTLGTRWLKEAGKKDSHEKKNKTKTHDIDKWENYSDFLFVREPALILLPQKMRAPHGFTAHNLTLGTQQCFGSDLVQLALPSDGVDVVTLNMVTFTFRQSGMLKSSPTNVYRDISSSYFSPFQNFGLWLSHRFSILLRSLLCFVFVSTGTSLMIRVLVSSGVVLLFPIFWMFTMFGADRNLLHPRIIALSYPWIGIPMEVIGNAGISTYPFILSHFIRLVVYYFMFQATQLLMSLLFYDDDIPGVIDMWLFAVVMTAEYFSMVYVRSVKSIQVFPRMTLALFLLYHFYIYLHPTGFHLMALWVFFLFELVLMMFCLTQYEIPAFACGEVTIDSPRAMHNSLPWPTWPVALAPDYTLFLPVTHRAMNIYGDPSGTAPAAEGDAGEQGGDINREDRRRLGIDEEEEGVVMNVLRIPGRGRADSEESLDIEVGRGLEPIAIGSSAVSAQGRSARNRPSSAYAALSGDDRRREGRWAEDHAVPSSSY